MEDKIIYREGRLIVLHDGEEFSEDTVIRHACNNGHDRIYLGFCLPFEENIASEAYRIAHRMDTVFDRKESDRARRRAR